MKTIYKYPIKAADEQSVQLPKGAKILCVQTQNGQPWLWAEVDTQVESVPFEIKVRGTGHPFDGSEGVYIGTFQLSGGALVFHVFEAA
jgi:hypothetical protein